MNTTEILRLYIEDRLSYRQIARRFETPYQKIRAVVVAAGASRTRSECKQGELNPTWKGGRFLDAKGYWHIYRPEHPHTNSNGYVLEHRLVMEEMVGRLLDPAEVVHHRDHNPGNNAVENLELMSRPDHNRFHMLEKGRSTHCKRGHERTETNTYVDPSGNFHCRPCLRLRERGYEQRDRGKRKAMPPRPPVTHCKRGHEFTDANTSVTPDGRRQCRECHRTRNREWMRENYRKPHR